MRTTSEAEPGPQLRYGPKVGKVFAIAALGGLPLWLALKFQIPSTSGAAEIVSALAALFGILASIAIFVGPYGFQANAPATRLDECQLAQRDRIHLFAFRVLALLTFAGWLAAEAMVSGESTSITTGVLRNFIYVIFVLSLTLPGALLALNDSGIDDD